MEYPWAFHTPRKPELKASTDEVIRQSRKKSMKQLRVRQKVGEGIRGEGRGQGYPRGKMFYRGFFFPMLQGTI